MRGRKPKPTALHDLHGTFRATRHKAREAEPKAVGDLLSEPPDWMTDGQQAGWRYAVENAPKGVLRRIDRDPNDAARGRLTHGRFHAFGDAAVQEARPSS